MRFRLHVRACRTLLILSLLCGQGCRTSSQRAAVLTVDVPQRVQGADPREAIAQPEITLVEHSTDDGPQRIVVAKHVPTADAMPEAEAPVELLSDLEALALANNPTLRRLQQEAAAEYARVGYVGKLPDPSVGGMVFTPPMMFDPDRQRADLQAMQMIPWLGRLRAEERQACLEALAAENTYRAERLRVLGDLRANWFKLYVLNKQIETTTAEQAQVESLVKTANARIATGNAQPGDVLMAALELSALQERRLAFRREFFATSAEINRIVGRDVAVPITPPSAVPQENPDWDYEFLRQTAHQLQPELNAARLRIAAAGWGLEVARLKRRPEVTLGAGWVIMDAPGATMPGAGRDSFTLGVTTTVPLWKRKYDAVADEAARKHFAAHASEDETRLEIDALLYDLWRQAETGRETLDLYEKSILPQARQTFEADQKSLVNNAATFDRVVRDYQALLSLQLGYHKALGEYAATLARIRQTVGIDLSAEPDSGTPLEELPSMTKPK